MPRSGGGAENFYSNGANFAKTPVKSGRFAAGISGAKAQGMNVSSEL